jgi:hypothetical protein
MDAWGNCWALAPALTGIWLAMQHRHSLRRRSFADVRGPVLTVGSLKWLSLRSNRKEYRTRLPG